MRPVPPRSLNATFPVLSSAGARNHSETSHLSENTPLPCLRAAVTPHTTKHTSPIRDEFVLKTHERVLKLPFIRERRFKLWNSGRTNLRPNESFVPPPETVQLS